MSNSVLPSPVREGDWVTGTSFFDEKFRGYVESIHPFSGIIKVNVTECDNAVSVGRAIECTLNRLQPLPEEEWHDGNGLSGLIDLALATKDKEWFMDLTAKLQQSERQQEPANASGGWKTASVRRW
jgi:hypothetical protein